jgi:hypothetical protein
MTGDASARWSVDTRSRAVSDPGPDDPASFWSSTWRVALERNGARAGDDAARLGVRPLTVTVDGEPWTLRPDAPGVDVVAGRRADLEVSLDGDAVADLVTERRTALGLVIGARVTGEPVANAAFCEWDPVLRSVLDGRGVHRPGDVGLVARDGGSLDLERGFRLGADEDEAAHFLAEVGFLLLTAVFSESEMDEVDADLARAVGDARPDDGESWWAATRAGQRYPCRILNFERRSSALRALVDDSRFLGIGAILGDGHRPGDPFGEHFDDLTAEGLVKRVDSVEGLACLPWHKDCDRGGHSMYCSGLTIGICLTPVDTDHGGLDVMAGSHRANIARTQTDRGIDLPSVSLRAARGDVTVHLSCSLHRSTHPTRRERRVAYTGFTLPPLEDPAGDGAGRARLERERAAIGGADRASRLAGGRGPDDAGGRGPEVAGA